MKRQTTIRAILVILVISCLWAPQALAQTAVVFDPPDPTHFWQETEFVIDGGVGLVVAYDAPRVWSFSLATGMIVDPDGLAYTGTADLPTLFPAHKLASAGWFPDVPGILVVDASDPANLTKTGVIQVPFGSNVQGENIVVDPDGVTGYVASFANDRLFSFNVQTMTLTDPDGLWLPGSPDRIALAGDRVALVDTANGRIMVVDVSNPADMTLVGVISLPGNPTFGSTCNIEFADDGRTGFVASTNRRLYSFDVIDLVTLDPDGVVYGTSSLALSITRSGSTIGCLWGRGLAFVDASDPTNMTVFSNAHFGEVVAPQGSSRVGFSADGGQAAVPVIYPGSYVYTFDVATGEPLRPRFAVSQQPDYLAVFGQANCVGVVCAGQDPACIWMITGLLDETMAVEDGATPAVRALAITPNPSSGPVRIVFNAGIEGRSSITIFDAAGRLVRTLGPEHTGAGPLSVEWDATETSGRPLAGGVYFVRLDTPRGAIVNRLVRTR